MPPITFAHRGGSADRRENTLEAFLHARDAGVTGLESDVRLAADGVPVLVHGRRVRLGARWARVDRTSARDLAASSVPALADLYRVVGTELEVSLDVKEPEAAAAAVEAARAAGAGALRRLWLCSPDVDVLVGLRRSQREVRLVHSTTRTALDENIERHAATLAEESIDAFNLHRTEWSAGLVVLFHRFEVLAFAWDVQEVRHLREVLAYGVDALYSDHPHRMVATVAEWTESLGPRTQVGDEE